MYQLEQWMDESIPDDNQGHWSFGAIYMICFDMIIYFEEHYDGTIRVTMEYSVSFGR